MSLAFFSRQKFLWSTVYLLSFTAIFVSAYLWYSYSQPEPIGCNVIAGCQTVRESAYSKLMGIDLPVYGFFYFLSINLYAASRLMGRKIHSRENLLFFLFSLSGVLFSVYLTYLELFVIMAICQWCLVSAALTIFLFAEAVVLYLRPKSELI